MKKYPIIPALILTALAAGTLWQSALAEEPPRRSLATPSMLMPFEAYAKHREAIGLSEDQVRELSRIAEGMGDAARKLEAERRERTEALQQAVAQRPIELDRAMMRFQAVLQVENEMKALQFRSGVAAQNLLTPEQAERMRDIAAKIQGARDSNASPSLASVRDRIEQLRGDLRKREGVLSKETVSALERLEQTSHKGNLVELTTQLEGLLAKLDQVGETRRKEPAEDPKRVVAFLTAEVTKTEKELAGASDPEQREKLQQQLAKLRRVQEYFVNKPNASQQEKSSLKGEGEKKDKGKEPERPVGEGKEKSKQPEGQDKIAVKGGQEAKEKGNPDKNAENIKRSDPNEYLKRFQGALAEFREAMAAHDAKAVERITKSMELMVLENGRSKGIIDGSFKEGERKEGTQKDGERKEGAIKEGAIKDATRREGAQKDGERKEGAIKDGTRREGAQKDGERKEAPPTDSAPKDTARKDGTP